MSIVAESYTSIVRYCSRHKSYCVLPTRVGMKCCHTTFILCQWHQNFMGSRKLIKRWSHGWSKLQLHMGYVRLKNSEENWTRQLVSERQYSWNAQFQRPAFALSCYLKNHFRGTTYIHTYVLYYVRTYKWTPVTLHCPTEVCTYTCRYVCVHSDVELLFPTWFAFSLYLVFKLSPLCPYILSSYKHISGEYHYCNMG